MIFPNLNDSVILSLRVIPAASPGCCSASATNFLSLVTCTLPQDRRKGKRWRGTGLRGGAGRWFLAASEQAGYQGR